MPQKRKASELASAKIAENAAVNTRRRRSDPKNAVSSNNDSNNKTNTVDDDSNKNLDDNKESLKNNNNNNNNEEKDDSTEIPPDKRRRKSEEDHTIAENNQQQNGSSGDSKLQEIINDESMMSISSIKSTQENDSANKMDYEPSSQKEEEKKDQQPTTTMDSDKQSYEKIRKEDEKELEKKVHPKILEKGHVCFLYRPKVGTEEPKNVEEVQRMYIVLLPHVVRHSLNEEPVKSYFNLSIEGKLDENSGADKTPIGKARVIAIGKKKLPEIEKHSKLWGFIDKAFNDLNEVKEFVSGRTYQTSTKGQRSLQDCRIFGRGAYSIVEHNGHTHLAYVLEIPEEPNEVQKEFNVKHEGSYVISVKNPDITNPPHTGLPEYEKVTYPEHLVQKFQKRRFISMESAEFLDYNGAELLFIGAKENLTQDLGEAGKELEELAEYEIKTIAPFAERVVFDDLHLEKNVVPAEPLHGLWK